MKERFTPKIYVEWYAKKEGLSVKDFGVAPTVVVSWQYRTVESLAKAIDGKIPEHWFYADRHPLYTGNFQGNKISVVRPPFGAAGTVMMMEEMIACGATTFIGLGTAGSLQESAPVGAFIIPTSVLSEEGTSPHYVSKEVVVGPDENLAGLIQDSCKEEGLHCLSGQVWTNDAPYRELVNKIEDYHERGVLGVDMETSAMYALGVTRNVKVCNLLVVSDELWREWRPAFGTPELRSAQSKAEQAILRCLAKLPKNPRTSRGGSFSSKQATLAE